ncbi:retrovirus-related pol polyprotein from transposon TNT 1-94 [Tanacetum coccineum]
MVIYNALPRKIYERIFMCNTTKEIWKTLLIIHQGNSQVKDNKIDLLVQQNEQFVISEDESIDNAFARFNTIITSLKALDEGYSSKNYVRKFLRALHIKWRSKVTTIEESKDLTSLSLNELIDEECLTFGSEDEEYAMAVRDFKKFLKRRGSDPNSSYWRMSKTTERQESKSIHQRCLGVDLEPDEWIKDSECSKHMTGNQNLFSSYKAYNREPKNVNEALKDESWIIAMQEELNQFVANDVWELVAQCYNQQDGIDYDETYALVARLEFIRILLAYACAIDFKLFQMDVKSAFLNGFINEEVYVAQPPGFIKFEKPNHVYKLKKALYGLKQAPKAWYDRLKAFLIKHEYKMRMVDNTLFTMKKNSNLIIVQIYVDDIIFGSTCQNLCDEFAKIKHDEFEISMMGELNFFLRLQIKQMEDGIFFNQSKYMKEMLKNFGLEESKPMKTPMSSDTKLTKDEECESVDSTKYRGMIGSLLYLTTSRPDIMFCVCLCAHFQEDPKTSHLEAVKRIFRYIKGTTHLGLWYP